MKDYQAAKEMLLAMYHPIAIHLAVMAAFEPELTAGVLTDQDEQQLIEQLKLLTPAPQSNIILLPEGVA